MDPIIIDNDPLSLSTNIIPCDNSYLKRYKLTKADYLSATSENFQTSSKFGSSSLGAKTNPPMASEPNLLGGNLEDPKTGKKIFHKSLAQKKLNFELGYPQQIQFLDETTPKSKNFIAGTPKDANGNFQPNNR